MMIQTLPFLTIIMLNLINQPVLSGIVLADFQQQALDQHNYYRQLHCTVGMTLNSSLNTIAQNYAEYLAANNIFNHSQTPGLGENLYYRYSSAGISSLNGKNDLFFIFNMSKYIHILIVGSVPTTAWYDEISMYNYSSPGFSSATGHFTQVIWLGSTQLGIGVALTTNGQTAYVVGNYYPPGNYLSQFATNVLPLCTSTTTVGTTSTNGTTSAGGTTSTNGTTSAGGTTSSTTVVTTTTSKSSSSMVLPKPELFLIISMFIALL